MLTANAFIWTHDESHRAEHHCLSASLWADIFYAHTALLAAIQSVMSQQVFSIISRRQHSGCHVSDCGVATTTTRSTVSTHRKKQRGSFKPSVRVVWKCVKPPISEHCPFSLGCDYETGAIFSTEATVVALNIKWNLIYLESQGNQSLHGAEWFWVHYKHLQEGMWLLRRDQRGCAGITVAHCLGLCLKLRLTLCFALILNILFFKT